MVNRIEDRKGNFINFTYSEFNGQGFIQEIAYTGNDQTNLEPFYTINFTYLADRNDAMKYFISGSAIENDFLMASIAVSYNTSQVMRYDLEYDLTGFQNHLKRIKLTMKDGQSEEYFNPTLFNWGTEDHQCATETLAYNYVNTDRYYLDINGDGKTDMVEAYWSLDGNNLKVYADLS